MSEQTYKIKLELNDKVYKSDGKTAMEAVKKLNKPSAFKTRAMLTASKGKKSHTFNMPIFRIKRMFMSDLHMIVMAKNIDIMIK